MFNDGLGQITRLTQAKVDELRALGCNEIYLTANSKIMTVSTVQVVFIAPARNLAQLEKSLILPEEIEFGWVFQHAGNKLIANLITPFSTTSMSDVNVGNRVAFQHQLIRPMVRPELVAGLERVKNAPIKFVFAPDGVIRGLWQGIPAVYSSRMIGGYDHSVSIMFMNSSFASMKKLEESFLLASFGLDPARPVLALTVQAKSPKAAQDLHDLVVQQKVMLSAFLAMENMGNYNRYGGNGHNPFEQMVSALDFAMLFLPDVRGDQLQLVIDEKRLGDTT